jgi:DNA invertase Pin-like site-specific DNA recombinase
MAYVRQSQDRDGEKLGITRQTEDCQELIARRGWQLVRVIPDNDKSAAGRKARPGFEDLLRTIQAGEAKAVVAWSLDRLTRNRRDTVRLIEVCEKYQIHLALVRGSDIDMGTPSGRLTADVLASVARHEIEAKSDRQRRAVEQAAAQGRRVGGRRAFGYWLDMTPHPIEAAAVRAAYADLLSGATLAGIARAWNAKGLVTPQGRREDGSPSRWIPQVLSRTLRKACYAGLRSHRGRIVGPATWEPLVDESVWRAAQAVLDDPSRRTPGGPRGLLTGLGVCAVCGGTVHGGGATQGQGRIYRCSKTYGHVSRRAEPVERFVSEVVIERLSRGDAADLLLDHDRPDIDKLRGEADQLRRRIDALADEYAADTITLAQLTRATERLRARVAEIETKMAATARVDILGPLVGADDARAVWDRLDVDRRRAVIGVLMTVVIYPAGRGTRLPDIDRDRDEFFRRIGPTISIEWKTA